MGKNINHFDKPEKGLCAVPAVSPPGLEDLVPVEKFFFKQKVSLMEVACECPTACEFQVLDTEGQQIYLVLEDSGCLQRNFCLGLHPFETHILDNRMFEVIHLARSLSCTGSLCPCCSQEMEVQAPPGIHVGYVLENVNGCDITWLINNEHNETLFYVKVPNWCQRFFLCPCCLPQFPIMSAKDHTQIGLISKEWAGWLKEIFTDADNFEISFPLDLDVKTKATVLGAVFLLNVRYFEKKTPSCPGPMCWITAAGTAIAHWLD